jgi:hypothetical protein
MVSSIAKGDPQSTSKNFQKIPTSEILKMSFSEDQDHLWLDTLPVNNPGGDPGGDPLPLPLIEEKGIYWSLMFKKEVKVFQIFDVHSEVSCQVPGRGRLSLPFTDLQCCEQSPRSNLIVGHKVEVQEGKYKNIFATIIDIRVDGIWLKCDDRRKPLERQSSRSN